MNKHTQTPWCICYNHDDSWQGPDRTYTVKSGSKDLFYDEPYYNRAPVKCDAERIVKCVNLIAELEQKGITIEQLEKLANGDAWIAEYVNQASVKQDKVCLGISTLNKKAEFNFAYKGRGFVNFNFIKPTHIMTFNGKTDVPKPKENEQ